MSPELRRSTPSDRNSGTLRIGCHADPCACPSTAGDPEARLRVEAQWDVPRAAGPQKVEQIAQITAMDETTGDVAHRPRDGFDNGPNASEESGWVAIV